jgi:transketolase
MTTMECTKKARVETASGYFGSELELKSINTIRAFCADMVQAANSGHPGAPMGCAPMAYLLWAEYMKYSPSNPTWRNRDRFVLSNGHACALQYCMLHMTGYDISEADCQNFRKLHSKTPGHPENFATPGIEVSTGPLGQGISNAVGLAISEKHLAAITSSEVADNFTWVICGDGCLQEGISSEACSLAGHLGLGKLIVLYDDNGITIDGSTELSFTEDVNLRYDSYGWHTQTVSDIATGLDDLRKAIDEAKAVTDKPSMIKVKTAIGYGSVLEGLAKSHGAPLGHEDIANCKTKFGMDPTAKFAVDDDIKEFWSKVVSSNEERHVADTGVQVQWKEAHPTENAELERRFDTSKPCSMSTEDMIAVLPTFVAGTDKDLATRKYSEQVLNALAPLFPEMMGGSADLTGSNLTAIKGEGDFQKDTPKGRYLRFGVREHGMTAIANGMFAYGGYRPFVATFLNFAGYALGAMRLSALSEFGILYIMTHDSVGLGEDGPTHQPVEMLECLRATPNMNVWRPADYDEVAAAYVSAMECLKTPSVIACSRSTVDSIVDSTIEKALKGGYVAYGSSIATPAAIIIATGSEVGPSIKAAKALAASEDSPTHVHVVSMPCQELFLAQSDEYRKSILPGDVPTLSVEAAGVQGWQSFAHQHIGMTTFGLSGPGPEVFEHFGFTAEHIVDTTKELLDFYKGRSAPNLYDLPPLAKSKAMKNANAHGGLHN